MKLKKQKLLARRILKTSSKNIKFVPKTSEHKKILKEAISREDIRGLVKEKIIKKLPKRGVSRTSRNYILSQKKKR